MTDIHVIVTGPEEAYDNEAEFWCANELMGVTVLHEGRLHLRIDPARTARRGSRTPAASRAPWPRRRSDSRPIDAAPVARSLPRGRDRAASRHHEPAGGWRQGSGGGPFPRSGASTKTSTE
jgi:hypothetical protein